MCFSYLFSSHSSFPYEDLAPDGSVWSAKCYPNVYFLQLIKRHTLQTLLGNPRALYGLCFGVFCGSMRSSCSWAAHHSPCPLQAGLAGRAVPGQSPVPFPALLTLLSRNPQQQQLGKVGPGVGKLQHHLSVQEKRGLSRDLLQSTVNVVLPWRVQLPWGL